jgi:hypothetical protein
MLQQTVDVRERKGNVGKKLTCARHSEGEYLHLSLWAVCRWSYCSHDPELRYVLDTTQKEQELTKIAASEDQKPPQLLGHGTAGQALAFCYLSWTMGGISSTQLLDRRARGRRSGG